MDLAPIALEWWRAESYRRDLPCSDIRRAGATWETAEVSTSEGETTGYATDADNDFTTTEPGVQTEPEASVGITHGGFFGGDAEASIYLYLYCTGTTSQVLKYVA